MSRYLSKRQASLKPYTPGEQPKDQQYIKLNPNESPFSPSPKAQAYAKAAAENLQLYSDPECTALKEALARLLQVEPDEVLPTNGSDEILNFAFMAFADEERPAIFPDITYGFYPVFADLNHVPYTEAPLKADFSIDPADYAGQKGLVVIANPNAPTGMALSRDEMEKIIAANPEAVVVVDEAYVDFGGESCVPLIRKYDNLLVTQTFSKSRSMAGARLGFGVGCKALIRDLNAVKYATNPYNVNRMTMAAGVGAIEDEAYTRHNCETIMQNREWTAQELAKLGFECLPSKTNFLFVRHPALSGQTTYEHLRQKGILVRHFAKPRLNDFNRITIGTLEQMQSVVQALWQEVQA